MGMKKFRNTNLTSENILKSVRKHLGGFREFGLVMLIIVLCNEAIEPHDDG